MLRFFFFTVIAAAILFPSNTQAQAYKIDIHVKGLKDSTAYLSYYYGKGQYYRDTTTTSDKGEIVFDGADSLTHGMYSLIVSGEKIFDIMIDAQNITMETDTNDLVGNMKIKGSKESTIFYSYLNFLDEKQAEARKLKKEQENSSGKEEELLAEELKQLDDEVRSYISNFHKKNKGTFTSNFIYALEYPVIPEAPKNEDGSIDSSFKFRYFKEHFFDNFNFSDSRLLRTSTYHDKITYYLEKLTLQDADSLIEALDFIFDKIKDNEVFYKFSLTSLTGKYERSENMGMDAVFVHLVKNYFVKEPAKSWYDDEQMKKLTDRANALDPLLIGKKAPNIVVKDTSQKKFLQLYEIDADFTVVYIWSPECGHCKVETPKLKKLYDKVKDRGVEVFGIGNEFENKEWIEFIDKHDLNWINGSDGPDFQSNFRHLYDVYSTPQTYLLDKDKKILTKKMSVDSLEKILEYFMEQRDKEKADEK